MHMKKLMLAVMGLAAVAGGSARAAGVAVDLHSARAVGMAGAVSAFVDDASAIYFNPAGIAQGQGLEFMIGASPIIPSFKVTPQIPGGANNNQITGLTNVIPPPFIYFTYGISDEWTVGIGVYSPCGLTSGPRPAPDRSDHHHLGRPQTYDISPPWREAWSFRIGVGLQMMRRPYLAEGHRSDRRPDNYAHGPAPPQLGRQPRRPVRGHREDAAVQRLLRSGTQLRRERCLHQRALVREHPGTGR
jgi:long-subunit fatty acid transport protein